MYSVLSVYGEGGWVLRAGFGCLYLWLCPQHEIRVGGKMLLCMCVCICGGAPGVPSVCLLCVNPFLCACDMVQDFCVKGRVSGINWVVGCLLPQLWPGRN